MDNRILIPQTSTKQTVPYSVVRNAVYRDGNTGEKVEMYTARVQSRGTLNAAELAQRIHDKNITIPADNIESVLKNMGVVVAEVCSEGYNADFNGFVTFRPSIKGNIATADGAVGTTNSLIIKAAAGKNLRVANKNAGTEKVDAMTLPKIASVKDLSGTTEGQISTAGMFIVEGKSLTFDAKTYPGDGFVLTDADSGTEITCSLLRKLKAGQLLLKADKALQAGTLKFALKTHVAGGAFTAAYKGDVTVA